MSVNRLIRPGTHYKRHILDLLDLVAILASGSVRLRWIVIEMLLKGLVEFVLFDDIRIGFEELVRPVGN